MPPYSTEDEDNFTSITWESADNARATGAAAAAGASTSAAHHDDQRAPPSGVDLVLGTQSLADPYSRPHLDAEDGKPRWEGYLMVQITEARKEHEGTKEQFVSYGIRAEVRARQRAAKQSTP